MNDLYKNLAPVAWPKTDLTLVPMRLQIAFSRALEPQGSILSIIPAPTPADGHLSQTAAKSTLESEVHMQELAEVYHLARFTTEMLSLVLAAGKKLESMMAKEQKPMSSTPQQHPFDSVLKWSQFGLQVFPMILQAILLAEQTLGSGNGETKKALVMGAVSPFVQNETEGENAQFAIGEAVDNTVATLNQAGKLGTKPPRQVQQA